MHEVMRRRRPHSSWLLWFLAVGIALSAMRTFWLLHHSTSTSTSASTGTVTVSSATRRNTASLQSATTEQEHGYLRFDDAAPPVLWAVSHSLPDAVPTFRRIPDDQVENETYHVQRRTQHGTSPSLTGSRGSKPPFYRETKSGLFDWERHDYNTDTRALYLYNPSLLPLWSPHSHPHDPDRLSYTDYQRLTGGDTRVAYVAIFRANTGGSCFGSDRITVMKTGEQISYLAVALLDRNLDLIPHTDVLIDLNAGPSTGKYWRQFLQDCRITLVQGVVYLICNEHLLRVKITRTFNNNTDASLWYTGPDTRLPYVYPNIYGDGLRIVLYGHKKIASGKNLNLFRVPSTVIDHATNQTSKRTITSYDWYLQNYPVPHQYQKLILPSQKDDNGNSKTCLIQTQTQLQSHAALPMPSFEGPDTKHTITTCPENEDGSGRWITNCTRPVTKSFFDNKDHGTACCVTVKWPVGRTTSSTTPTTSVMVGISHVKTKGLNNPWWRRDIYGRYNGNEENDKLITIGHKRYLSRFVAYNMTPPFDVVAVSGWFCLGFAHETERTVGNPPVARNIQYRLDLFNDTFACPHVHFASGIADWVGDPGRRAVISYGVSDCHARMIVMSKQDIANRLLGRKARKS